jgi:hypothetical protein
LAKGLSKGKPERERRELSMKKTLIYLTIIGFCAVCLTGCFFGHQEYLVRTVKTPVNAWTDTRYTAEANSYKILGTVKAEGRSTTVLGIVVEGKEGTGLLWEEAQDRYGDKLDGIKDISAISTYKAILPPIYGEIITTYYGKAIQMKK